MAKNVRTDGPPRPLLGLLVGLAAGIAAAAAMEAFQSGTTKLSGGGKDDDRDQDDSATVKAADTISKAAIGDRVPEPFRQDAGRIVHYAVGAALGAAYGVITEYRPAAASGFGTAYGAATALLLDESAVPAAGLGAAPWKTPMATHAYSFAAHTVYGMALEGARKMLGGR